MGKKHINKQIQRHCAQKRTLVLCIILFYIIELSSSFAQVCNFKEKFGAVVDRQVQVKDTS